MDNKILHKLNFNDEFMTKNKYIYLTTYCCFYYLKYKNNNNNKYMNIKN